MNCSICLDEFNNKKNIFKLSCNHQLHYECFLRYSYQVGHLFIDCPMCREMNINTQLPNLDTVCCENISALFLIKFFADKTAPAVPFCFF